MPNLAEILSSFSKVAPHLENPFVLYGLVVVLTAAVVLFGEDATYFIALAVFVVLIVFVQVILRSEDSEDNHSSSEAIIDAASDLVDIAEELEGVDRKACISVLGRARDLCYFVGREDLASEIRKQIDGLRPAEPF